MPHTPPIDIMELRKTGALDESKFFRGLSEECNYVDPATIKEFYMGLVRHITSDLRANGVARLPHIGDFALVKQAPKIGWAGKFRQYVQGKYMLKFYPKDSWRDYFTALAKKPGREGRLDPRERLLNQELQ